MNRPLREPELEASAPAAQAVSSVESATFLIMGAAQDTGNLGVSALGLSTVEGLRLAFPSARFIVEMNKTPSEPTFRMADDVCAEAFRLYVSSGLRGSSSIGRVRALSKVARFLPRALARRLVVSNRSLEQLHRADVVMDISAGDSFSDIYGQGGFEFQLQRKELILRLHKPLVLLPQTLGPFEKPGNLRRAATLLSGCTMVATRELKGIDEAARLFGADVASRLVLSPDVAFILRPMPVAAVEEPFAHRANPEDVIGLNVNGLFYRDSPTVQVAVDYRRLVLATAEWALSKPGVQLLLVPHVIGLQPPGSTRAELLSQGQSDTAACRLLLEQLREKYGDRVGTIGWPRTASETKYLIGRCRFFIGARMHACIGAVSQCVPAANHAYSKKVAGVMGQIGIGDTVVDLRTDSIDECLLKTEALYQRRAEIHAVLAHEVPRVQAKVHTFFRTELRTALAGTMSETACRTAAGPRVGG